MVEASNTSSIVSVRVSADERSLLEAAADQLHVPLSDFVRRRALEAAESEVLNRAIVTIAAKDWAAFEAWAGRPAEAVPALTELAHRTLSWER